MHFGRIGQALAISLVEVKHWIMYLNTSMWATQLIIIFLREGEECDLCTSVCAGNSVF